MKTIATAAVLMILSTATWAAETQNEQANDPANANQPIVLSEAEMDGITAGDNRAVKWFNSTKGYGFISPDDGSYEAVILVGAHLDCVEC